METAMLFCLITLLIMSDFKFSRKTNKIKKEWRNDRNSHH